MYGNQARSGLMGSVKDGGLGLREDWGGGVFEQWSDGGLLLCLLDYDRQCKDSILARCKLPILFDKFYSRRSRSLRSADRRDFDDVTILNDNANDCCGLMIRIFQVVRNCWQNVTTKEHCDQHCSEAFSLFGGEHATSI